MERTVSSATRTARLAQRRDLVATATQFRLGRDKLCYDWTPGSGTRQISTPAQITLVVLYQLFIDYPEVPFGVSREKEVIDEAMIQLSRMQLSRRADGSFYEVSPGSFQFAARYFMQSLGYARQLRRQTTQTSAA